MAKHFISEWWKRSLLRYDLWHSTLFELALENGKEDRPSVCVCVCMLVCVQQVHSTECARPSAMTRNVIYKMLSFSGRNIYWMETLLLYQSIVHGILLLVKAWWTDISNHSGREKYAIQSVNGAKNYRHTETFISTSKSIWIWWE